MSDSMRESIEFSEKSLGINPVDDEAFRKAYEDFHHYVRYCNKEYNSDRPPEGSEDYPVYITKKKKLASFYVHCKNERFRETLLRHHPEFADL